MTKRLVFRLLSIVLLGVFVFGCGCQKDDLPESGHYDPNPPDPPDPPEYSIPEIQDIVMYEANIRAFGNGSDFQAVIGRLEEIEKLQVNVLWLMPIHPIGTINSVNSPYSVQDFKAINPEFGTNADFQALVDSAHGRGMAVILDWVANHTAWDNPWIENKDWYTQDGSGNIVHPPGTNWLDVADLNYDNEEMRLAMIDAMKYWVTEFGIDGFRCDAADWVPYDFWKQALDSLSAIPERELIFLAEGERDDHYSAGFQIAFSWLMYSRIKQVFNGEQSPGSLENAHQSEYNGIPSGARRLMFTTNHDESAWDATPVELFNGIDGALAASAVSTFIGGVPMIYGSQEVGVADPVPFFSTSAVNWSQNPEMFQAYREMMEIYSASEAAKTIPVEFFDHGQVAAFTKQGSGEELFVLVNTTENAVNYTLPGALVNTAWTDAIMDESFVFGEDLTLQGYAYRIFTR